MAMAKNIAVHRAWGVRASHFTSSSSSLLWTGSLAFLFATLGVHEVIPFIVNTVGTSVQRSCGRDGRRAGRRVRGSLRRRITSAIPHGAWTIDIGGRRRASRLPGSSRRTARTSIDDQTRRREQHSRLLLRRNHTDTNTVQSASGPRARASHSVARVRLVLARTQPMWTLGCALLLVGWMGLSNIPVTMPAVLPNACSMVRRRG
jgi:hypothetical protein